MSTIRRVLCPVDFSPASEKAIDYAVGLAQSVGAELELVHVFQLPIYALPDGAMMAGPEMTTRLSNDLTRALKELSERKAGGVPSHLVEGVPSEEIVRMADELGADLIVMGTHGRTGLKHLLIGSVAERVVRGSKVPVITVPTR